MKNAVAVEKDSQLSEWEQLAERALSSPYERDDAAMQGLLGEVEFDRVAAPKTSDYLLARVKEAVDQVVLVATDSKVAISKDISCMERDLGQVLKDCKRIDESLQLEQDLYELDERMRDLQKQLGQLTALIQIHRTKNERSRERLRAMRNAGHPSMGF